MVIVPLNMMIIMMIMMMDANAARAVLLPVRSVALYHTVRTLRSGTDRHTALIILRSDRRVDYRLPTIEVCIVRGTL